MIKFVNPILALTLEIIMLITFGYFGMTRPWSLTLRILFTILFISIALLLWAFFAAPKSEHRLQMPSIMFFRMLMFTFSAFLLFQLGNKNLSILVFVFALLSQTISYFTE